MKTKTKAVRPSLGPWEQAPCFMIQSKKGNYICTVDASEGNAHHANARLIAAAPELLAALQNAADEIKRLRDVHLPRYEGRIGEPDSEILSTARAAIAKATGNA